MVEEKKKQILKRATDLFKTTVLPNHLKNLKKLSRFSEFKYNPFLTNYLANFLTGNTSYESQALTLIYPRILGTSITTTFGTFAQKFCSVVLEVFGSATSGIDIEFTDQIDGRKKYCQMKAGPNTINHDDVKTIEDKFSNLISVARVNNLALNTTDMVVGVLYGTRKQLSPFYKKINKTYPVLVGQEFWKHLTGDVKFYDDLIHAFALAAKGVDGKKIIEEITSKLAKDIKSSS